MCIAGLVILKLTCTNKLWRGECWWSLDIYIFLNTPQVFVDLGSVKIYESFCFNFAFLSRFDSFLKSNFIFISCNVNASKLSLQSSLFFPGRSQFMSISLSFPPLWFVTTHNSFIYLDTSTSFQLKKSRSVILSCCCTLASSIWRARWSSVCLAPHPGFLIL